ncbi:nitrous oxide reductase family maturation protein NosD [Candidatus Halobeggiatoa sp. HSG11]|nr:nitrous oxide reductase family maturation protein NosD [Candidatus Halobeggiatoa sp. HSG11]
MKLLLVSCLSIFISSVWAFPSLQPLLDEASPNDILIIPAGTYSGPLSVEIPITIDGNNEVIIDGGGKDSVVYLDTDGAQLRNLHITNSGKSHNQIDACVQVRGNFNIIKDNILDNCLFGVDLQQSDNNIVRRNKISSKDSSLGMRGDAIRLWYSMNNKIVKNQITNSRDSVVWYSKNNLIADNVSIGGRYALHFMYSQFNRVENNRYDKNSTGIFLMYSDDVELRGNTISNSMGTIGMGIGFKETSGVTVENNQIIYCATGIYSDLSPYQPDTTNIFDNNKIAYNDIGVLFHNDWHGNILKNNQFIGNHNQVAVQGATTAKRNVWQDNYWDDYVGFDRNADGIGDTPYKIYSYADQIWMDFPATRFFKGSVILEVLNFLERLAPFTEPAMLLTDPSPRVK